MVDPSLHRLRDLFVRAAELTGRSREEMLESTCREDPELGAQLARLLEVRSGLGDFPGTLGPVHDLLDMPGPVTGSRLEPGAVVGDFVVREFLASGGGGAVYRAEETTLGRSVALKVLELPADDRRWLERFRREARLAAGVHHPNVVPVLGYGERRDLGFAYYAMRLVEGPTFAEILDARSRGELTLGPGEVRMLCERFVELADGLAALHDRQFVHRDVKPSNAMIESEGPGLLAGRAVLVDFGLLRAESSIEPSTVMATPGYAAPELLLGRDVDARTDVFSLGLVMYDVLAGRPPGSRPRPADQILTPLAREHEWVDQALSRIVERATDPRRNRRHASATALAAELRAWLAGRRVTPRSSRRIGWAALGLALTVGGFAWLDRAGPADPSRTLEAHATTWVQDGVIGLHDAIPALRDALTDSGSTSRAAEAVCARMFLDRPVLSPRQVEATATIRTVLRSRLRRERSVRDAGNIVCALGGCGLPEDVLHLVAWLGDIHLAAPGEGCEGARLALEAIARILHRAGPCGTLREVVRLDDEGWRERLEATLRARLVRTPDPQRFVTSSLGHALAARAFALRAAGRDAGPLGTSAGLGPFDVRVVAAHRERRLEERLLAEGTRLPDGDAPACYMTLWTTGYAAGCYGDDVGSAVRKRSLTAFRDPRLDPSHARAMFDAGVAEAERAAVGPRPSHSPDPWTRLGAALPDGGRWIDGTLTAQQPPPSDELVVSIDLARASCPTYGQDVALRMRATARQRDDYQIDAVYPVLGIAGESAVEIGFFAPAVGSGALWLELVCQRGTRPALPFRGSVQVDVLLDGAMIGDSEVPIEGDGVVTLRRPLCHALQPTRHRLTLRLSRGSNTTLRLYRVDVWPR